MYLFVGWPIKLHTVSFVKQLNDFTSLHSNSNFTFCYMFNVSCKNGFLTEILHINNKSNWCSGCPHPKKH